MRARKWMVVAITVGAFASAPAYAAKGATPKGGKSAVAVATPEPIKPLVMEVNGTVPDSLAGTWLVVNHTQGGRRKKGAPPFYSNSWYVLRLAHVGSEWRLNQLTGAPPQALATALNKATKQHAMANNLDAQTLDAARQVLPKLEQPKSFLLQECSLNDAAHIDAALVKAHPGARFSLVCTERGAHTYTGASGLFATEVTDAKITGEMEAGSISVGAGGRAVAPVGVLGAFTMFRLEAASAEPTPAAPTPLVPTPAK